MKKLLFLFMTVFIVSCSQDIDLVPNEESQLVAPREPNRITVIWGSDVNFREAFTLEELVEFDPHNHLIESYADMVMYNWIYDNQTGLYELKTLFLEMDGLTMKTIENNQGDIRYYFKYEKVSNDFDIEPWMINTNSFGVLDQACHPAGFLGNAMSVFHIEPAQVQLNDDNTCCKKIYLPKKTPVSHPNSFFSLIGCEL